MVKDDCIFCKLANGDIPTYALYEDDDFKVILDAAPSSKGHSLIIPKSHADNLFEMSDDSLEKVLKIAKKVGSALKESLNCDGVNILQNNGLAASQTVFHYHTHIIPRYENDRVNISWNTTKIEESDAIAFVNDIKERII